MARAPLPDACFLGDIDRVRELLEEGHDVRTTDEFGWTPLHRAVESGKVPILKLLIDNGADCDALTPAQSTAFHIAALHGDCEMAKVLIDADETPNVNEENVNGSTPIMGASFNCNPRMVKILLEQKANIIETDEDGWNCLHFAAWNASKEGAAQVADLLLEAGVDVTVQISVRHCEEDSGLIRTGGTATEIVKRRMSLMTEPEKENARAMQAVLRKWEDVYAQKQAKVASEKQQKKNFDAAVSNTQRRTSLAGRRKASLEAAGAAAMKESKGK